MIFLCVSFFIFAMPTLSLHTITDTISICWIFSDMEMVAKGTKKYKLLIVKNNLINIVQYTHLYDRDITKWNGNL